MTETAPERSSPGEVDHGEAVAAVAAAARRRLGIVLFVRHSSVLAPGGIAVGAALALAGLAPAWLPIALGLVGLAVPAVWALWYAPSTVAAAGQLDAALGLRDRVVAALNLRGTQAPIAPLVARDAAARLEGVRLATVFPLSVSRPAAALVPLAAALSLWLVWIGGASPALENSGTPSSAGASASGDAATRGDAGRSGAPATASRPDVSTAAERTRPQDSANESARRDSARAAGTTASSASARTNTPASPVPSRAARASAALESGPARGSGQSPAGGTPSGAGRGPATASADGTGGVNRGGALIAADAASARDTPSPARLAAARSGAEAALARDVVPPAYRDDVRAYFRSLAPGGPR